MEKIQYLSQQFWDTFNLEGFLIRKTTVYYQKKSLFLPSTREVSRVTFAALRLPAGKAIPILSSLSLRFLPPSFDLALMRDKKERISLRKIKSSHRTKALLLFFSLSKRRRSVGTDKIEHRSP